MLQRAWRNIDVDRHMEQAIMETMVVYHLNQKPIWFQTVQMEHKTSDWKILFGAPAYHFP